jgi:SulP family sulfate permease
MRSLVTAASSGLVIGVVEVFLATSFAALIFSGPLGAYLPAGLGLTLFAAMLLLLVLALFGSIRGLVGSVQDTTAAILALMAASLAARLPAGDRTFFTVVVAIGITTLLAGAFFFLLGTLRLGNLVRFVPFPVVGGFLAGTGWLLAKGGVSVLAGVPVTLSGLPELGRPEVLVKWLPGLGFAALLLVVLRRSGHFLILPAALVGTIALFYGGLLAAGLTVGEAQAGGWLLGPLPEVAIWEPWLIQGLGHADWSAILGQAGTIATLLVVGLLALLLNVSGIELGSNRDADLNRELRSAGLANAAAGLAGGIPGYHALSLTALAQRSGAGTSAVGVVAALTVGVALLGGTSLLELFPRIVVGGLILFLGFSFLAEWAYDARTRLPFAEYLLVLAILAMVATLGFLPGVAVGLLVAVILFAVNYSRTDVVKHALSGAAYRSNVDRSDSHLHLLRSHGDRIHVLELQGFVFFGTANALLERIRSRVADRHLPRVRFLVLDFRRVTGVDASAALSFARVMRLAEAQAFSLVLTGMSERVRDQLARGGVRGRGVRTFADLDQGMQWCEERVLRTEGAPLVPALDLIRTQLREEFGLDPKTLNPYLRKVRIPRRHSLMRQGEVADDLYLLESGRLTALLTRERQPAVRLRTMAPGAIIGEVGFYLEVPRTASVVSETPCTLHRLSRRALRRMEERDPELAAALHRLFARRLAERLNETLDAVRALLD